MAIFLPLDLHSHYYQVHFESAFRTLYVHFLIALPSFDSRLILKKFLQIPFLQVYEIHWFIKFVPTKGRALQKISFKQD